MMTLTSGDSFVQEVGGDSSCGNNNNNYNTSTSEPKLANNTLTRASGFGLVESWFTDMKLLFPVIDRWLDWKTHVIMQLVYFSISSSYNRFECFKAFESETATSSGCSLDFRLPVN